MSKITKLDRAALKGLAPVVEAELKALADRLGLTITYNGGQFGEGAEATLKLLIKVDDPEAKAAAARAIWDRNCAMIGYDFGSGEGGLRPEDLGTEFDYNRTTMRTTGIALKGKNSQKFPILVEIVRPGPQGGNAGDVRMLPEAAVKIIRAATDAKAKKAKAA